MATYESVMKFKSGKVLRLHHATSCPVGTELPANLNGAVAATNGVYVKFSRDQQLADYYSSNTAGQFEVIRDDDPTGVMFVTDASVANTNNARVTPEVTFQAGVTYKFVQRVAGAA
jgi:hypothetical protein